LASNSSLSLLDEMAFLRASRPDLTPAELFVMATRTGAAVLEGSPDAARLLPGAPADVVIARARGGAPANAAEALDAVTSGAVTVLATFVGGTICHLGPD